MTRHDWLFWLHVAGAILLIAGIALAAVLNLAAQTRERPSEIARLLARTRLAVVAVSLGMLITLAFGLWLVHDEHRSYGEGWIAGALALWVLANAFGGIGGRRDRKTREYAEQLASRGDAPSPELRRRLRDPLSLALSYGSGVAVLAILALMFSKPGA